MITSTSEVVVRYAETDMMGIVYHASYLPWLEIGRTQLLKERGMPYKTIEEQGLLLPVFEISMKYRKPATYDDVIVVKTTMREKPSVKIRMDYELSRGEDLIATGFSVHAFMKRNGQAIKIPSFFLEAINNAFV